MNFETVCEVDVDCGSDERPRPEIDTAQVRTMLDAWGIEVHELAAGTNSLVERAQLLAAAHAVLGHALRATIVEAPLGHCVQTWCAASAAAEAALMRTDTTVSEQTQFEVNWVRERIAMLATHPGPTPKPALLAAASLATEAVSTLLALERGPVGEGALSGWPSAISNLSLAFHLVNDEHSDLTQPNRTSFDW
ncbi:hypothetical protein GPX89_24815 [Nocardia sp. ET3-3]|uniref:Uncharacterized protein n=1 Tax=Nocardia terrae TaxID=2675851 RepID=A0A7K1V2V2_9NOCA|nr:hypothetical protein [Nocardia terrae]MVU80458.1 hypothetical protein [Nocardia terrae]